MSFWATAGVSAARLSNGLVSHLNHKCVFIAEISSLGSLVMLRKNELELYQVGVHVF